MFLVMTTGVFIGASPQYSWGVPKPVQAAKLATTPLVKTLFENKIPPVLPLNRDGRVGKQNLSKL